MELHKLTLEDKSWIDSIVLEEETHSSDFSFASMVIWNDEDDIKAGQLDGRLIACSKLDGKRFYSSPIGSGPMAPAIYAIDELCRAEGVPMLIYGVTEQNRIQLEQELPGKLDFKGETDYADYIYEIDKLADLSGRKLHSKKNHVNKFMSLYPDWKYERLKPEHFETCLELLESWQMRHEDANEDDGIDSEDEAIHKAFKYFNELELEGGVLYADGKMCAFTVGEKCTKDTFVVHFEKANIQVEGSFQMINREFVRQVREVHPEILYINREDDIGIASLRQSKQSYHPYCMEMKYTATWK